MHTRTCKHTLNTPTHVRVCILLQVKDSSAGEGELSEANLSCVTGLTEASLHACQSTIRSALAHDTTAISAAHSLHIYLERLGLATDRFLVRGVWVLSRPQWWVLLVTQARI